MRKKMFRLKKRKRQVVTFLLFLLILGLVAACRPATPTPAPTCPTLGPAPPGAIAPENVDQLTEIRRLGLGSLTQATFSPDGSLLAVGTALGVYLYDTDSGEAVRFFETEGRAGGVAFSPDGALLAVGLGGGKVELRRVSDGSLLRSWQAHQGGALSLAFTPDGHTLVTGAALFDGRADGRARLWRVSDGSLLGTLPPEKVVADITALAVSPDGTLLAAGTEGGAVYVWQYPEGARRYILAGATDRSATQLAFSPNGSLLAARFRGGSVTLWRMSDGQAVPLPEGFPQEVDTLAFDPDGTLWTASGEQGVTQWQVPEGNVLRTWEEGTEGWVMALGFTSAGKALAVTVRSGTLGLWHSDGQRRRLAEGHMGRIHRIAFSPDGETLAVYDLRYTVWLWRVRDGALLRRLDASALSLAFDPTGEVLATGSSDGTIRLWRVSDGTLLRSWQGHRGKSIERQVWALAFSPDGSLLASGGWDKEARLWRVADGTLVRRMEPPQYPDQVRNLAFSPDGSLLAGVSWGQLFLWQVEDGALLHTLWTHSMFSQESPLNFVPTDEPQGLAFSPDGKILAVTGAGGVAMWQVADGTPLCAAPRRPVPGSEFQVALNPAGSLAAAGSEDEGVVRLRRVADWAVLRTLEYSTGDVATVAFSPDGTLLAVGLDDGTVRLWEVQP